MTVGARFTAGYQFPATDHATLRRGRPVRADGPIGPHSTIVELVPIGGGRPDTWDVVCTWQTRDTAGRIHGGAASCIVVGDEQARAEYEATVAHLRAGGEPGAPR